MPFPGVAALPPCLGAAMIIAAGRGGDGIVARVLSWRPVVLIGLISYSLYLWHWPIIVLFKEATLQARLTHVQQGEIFAVCLMLSLLSWAFVENPMRRTAATRRFVFGAAAAGTSAVAVIAALLVMNDGFPQRLPSEAARLASYVGYNDPARFRTGLCFIDSRHGSVEFDADTCLHTTSGEPTVLLMGDSHAAHLWQAMARAMPNVNVLQATASGCRPTVTHAWGAARCVRVMDYVYQRYVPAHHVDLLVLSAAWTTGDDIELDRTLRWAQSHHVTTVVLGPSIMYDAPLPALLARESMSGDRGLVVRHQYHSIAGVDRMLSRETRAFPGAYVSMYQLMCPHDRCREFVGEGVPIQYDGDHFTPEGADFVVRQLIEEGAFQSAAPAHAPAAAHG
jgi:hypothetical protein